MKNRLIILILYLISLDAHSEIDSLYNSKWKGGLKISLFEMYAQNENGFAGHLLVGVPITRNIHHSSFNLESGIYVGGYIPFESPGQNYYDKKGGYNLGLPLKIKYDRDGMFLASGFLNWYCHTKYNGFDYWHEPVSFTIDAYFLKYNFTMGFEKYVGHDCEIFVDAYYERTLVISSDKREYVYGRYLESTIGFSLGFLIRGS